VKKLKVLEESPCPDQVKVELATVPRGETGYWILFNDETVELLSQGIADRTAAQYAWEALAWKRMPARWPESGRPRWPKGSRLKRLLALKATRCPF